MLHAAMHIFFTLQINDSMSFPQPTQIVFLRPTPFVFLIKSLKKFFNSNLS